MKVSYALVTGLLAAISEAQSPAWGQCGGQGWTGSTTCVSGWTCVYSNQWYSQCLQGVAATTSTTAKATSISSTSRGISSTLTTTTLQTSTSTSTASTVKSSTSVAAATGFKWLGVDESCGEFGQANVPGVYNTDFTFASTATLDTLMAEGYNIFRFPFLMERMAPGSLTATLSASYLANYTVAISHVTAKGGWAILDPHNFGRYNGAIITDIAGFQTFWTNLATAFKSNANVIFDTNNEYHDMDISLIVNLNQAAINGIRGTGATSQYIFAEGNSYSAAWFWNTTSDAMKTLTDPSDKLIYEMHLYLDSDNSGTSDVCYSSTVGVDRIVGATAWLRANNKIGVLGEFAGGANSLCKTAVTGLLDHLKANSDVWTGALWWAGGPWWGDYIYSFEPPSGTGYLYYDSLLKAYAPK